MKELKKQINSLIKQLQSNATIIEEIIKSKSIYPFSKEGEILAYLLANKVISYEQYHQISMEYSQRNQYLDLFDMAPRTFGETWGEKYILTLFPQFIKAKKKNMSFFYPNFDGEFDLWLEGIRVEVKACRANDDSDKKASLASRAYLHSEAIKANFKYHFQQLKPSCCDIFIWIGVYRDALIYWVLTSDELLKTGKLRPQHRNENTGIKDSKIFEGQVFMTEEELKPFQVNESEILEVVRQKGKKGNHKNDFVAPILY